MTALTVKTDHRKTVPASIESVFRLICDVSIWPVLFAPNIHVEILEKKSQSERLQLWALLNGEIKTWTSVRYIFPDEYRVRFVQEVPQKPVSAMSGEWILSSSEGVTEVVLTHEFSAENSDDIDWIRKAVDANSAAELHSLCEVASQVGGAEAVLHSFEDTVEIPDVDSAYDFVYRADLWVERLPHVRSVVLTEKVPNIQQLQMDTETSDSKIHTTSSYRVCQKNRFIAYKQTELPSLLLGHSGVWRFSDSMVETQATSQHNVLLNPEAVRSVLGPEATLQDAAQLVRRNLGANSRATLNAATRVLR